jgi:5-methylcytosine-specific restriction enzyme A
MAGSWRSEPLPPGWDSIRAGVLARDPICTWGTLPDEIGVCHAVSTDCDHTGDPGHHDPEALRGLCHPHHRIRSTAQAQAGRARMRALRRAPRGKHPAYK